VSTEGRGATEEVSLSVGNSESLERFEFFAALDAFRNDLATDLSRHRVKRPQQFLTCGVRIDPAHESHVDLDEVRFELHHRFEASVGDARVVECDLEAEIPVVVPRFPKDGEIVDRFTLRNLENEVFGTQAELFEGCAHRIAPEGGVVDRSRETIEEELAARLESARSTQRGAPTQTIEFEGQPRFLGELKKAVRGMHVGFPWASHERLVSQDLSRGEIDDRLIEDGQILGEHEVLEESMPLAASDRFIQLGIAPREFERGKDLSLGSETGIVKERGIPHREWWKVPVVGVHDLVAIAGHTIDELAGQIRKSLPVEDIFLPRSKEEDHEFIGARRARNHQVSGIQIVAAGFAHDRAQFFDRVAMSIHAVATFDLLEGGRVDEDHPDRAISGECLSNGIDVHRIGFVCTTRPLGVAWMIAGHRVDIGVPTGVNEGISSSYTFAASNLPVNESATAATSEGGPEARI